MSVSSYSKRRTRQISAFESFAKKKALPPRPWTGLPSQRTSAIEGGSGVWLVRSGTVLSAAGQTLTPLAGLFPPRAKFREPVLNPLILQVQAPTVVADAVEGAIAYRDQCAFIVHNNQDREVCDRRNGKAAVRGKRAAMHAAAADSSVSCGAHIDPDAGSCGGTELED